MDDLLVAPGPGAPHGLRVPATELIERFSHASGPGGQGMNTTDSRVQLSFDLSTSTALDETQRTRAIGRLRTRLAGTVLTITSSEFRSQRRNRMAARQRLADLLRDAVMPAPQRRASAPTVGSRRRRLDAKRRRAEVKAGRKKPDPSGP